MLYNISNIAEYNNIFNSLAMKKNPEIKITLDFEMDFNELGIVIFDELHWINDKNRDCSNPGTINVIFVIDIKINPADIKIDVYRASGPGGQSVNTTDSAVRLTYVPTGMIVTCQDEKSQHKNREKAMKVLRARLYDEEQKKMLDEQASERKQQVGSGDRSERIRTYNFPQERVTDHRIGLTLHKLSAIMEGSLDEVLDVLSLHFQSEALKGDS